MAQLATALQTYHATYSSYPAAAIWKQGPLESIALHLTKRIDLVTYDNWALRLLPFFGQQTLAEKWNPELPNGAPENAPVRTASLPAFLCPSDTFNRPDNPYQLSFEFSESPIEFARGNYGLNGGTHSSRLQGSTMAPNGDLPTFMMDEERGEFRWLGNGISGINWPLSQKHFRNGTSTLVAVEELRAGIHPLDPRGVWSFGQPGGSMTWAHGVNGDAFGPNNQWPCSDDIQGCADLHRAVGTQTLLETHMPCVDLTCPASITSITTNKPLRKANTREASTSRSWMVTFGSSPTPSTPVFGMSSIREKLPRRYSPPKPKMCCSPKPTTCEKLPICFRTRSPLTTSHSLIPTV